MTHTTQIHTDEQMIQAKAGIRAYEIELNTLAVTRHNTLRAIATFAASNHSTFTVDIINEKFSDIIELLDKDILNATTRCDILRVTVKEAFE
jgi:hypothetical protein|tara:strand:+ start:4314 stop:4589 length:276 start_codon:yes stop_codon:yes gene_type:complete